MASAARPEAAPRSSSWKPVCAIANFSDSVRYPWCEPQLTPSRQIAAAIDGCDLRGGALQRGKRLERSLVADLSQRQHRIVLQRAIELGDLGERREGVGALVVADRLDDGAAEEILARA